MTVRTIVSAPLGVVGDYPSHLAELGQGGFEVVANIAERDAITDSRKTDKMVLVRSNDAGVAALYFWSVDAWVEFDPASTMLMVDGQPVTEFEIGNNMVAEQDKADSGKFNLHVKHDAFEPIRKPSYLAYVGHGTDIALGVVPSAAHIRGDSKVAFSDEVVGNGMYIGVNGTYDVFSIEEADQGDPNLTGGTDYLISFRASMKGTAPSSGVVYMYLYDESVNPYDEDTYLTDANGEPLVVQKMFNKGDVLGALDITGIVNAKGQKSFTCHIVADFNTKIELDDRFDGGTGLMIQAITPSEKTGLGLMQYEIDTNNKLWFEHSDKDGYKLRESQNYGAQYGKYEEKYKAFIQDTQGFASLRYTVNNTEIPMPCGIPKKGAADITLDNSVNQIAGSGARGGEGALQFNSDGTAKISTSIRLSNETASNSDVEFWWVSVGPDGTMVKIAESARTFTVMAGQKNLEVVLPTFSKVVESGDRIALRAKSDQVDGVYLQTSSDRYPLVETTIDFKEITKA